MTKAMVRLLRTRAFSSCPHFNGGVADPGPIDGRTGRIIF